MLRSALIAKLNNSKTAPKSPVKKPPKTPKSKVKSKQKPLIPINSFDDEIIELGAKFRVEPGQVKQGLQGLIKFTSENPKLKNQLFDDEQFPIFVQINSIKVPRGHPRIVRIPLKHSLLTPDSEICLIVADVKGIPNKKHDEHLEQYEKLLRQKRVENVKKIMTFHEFRTEYETFELRSKLVELYDAFLVDGKVAGKTVKKCGKVFYKKRKVPTAVKLNATKLKEHVDQTLKKTSLYVHSKGDSFMVQVGHNKMSPDELVENIFYVIKGLEREFPGGFGNVRSLNLFAHRGLTTPIYTTLKSPNQVDAAKNVKNSKSVEKVSGELTTRLNSGVVVKSTGDVALYKLKNHSKRKSPEIGDDGERGGTLDEKKIKKKRKLDENGTKSEHRSLKTKKINLRRKK